MVSGHKVKKKMQTIIKNNKIKCIILYGFIIGTKMSFFTLFFTFKIYITSTSSFFFNFFFFLAIRYYTFTTTA